MGFNLKYFAVALVVVFLLFLVGASSISGTNYVSVGQCSTSSQKYSLCTGTSGTYSLSSSGAGFEWINFAPTSIFVNAGECKDVFIFFTPPCFATAGEYNPEINIIGPETGVSKIRLIVSQTHTFTFSVTPLLASANPCGESNYSISIKNTGKFVDEFVFSQKGLLSEWVNYPQEKITLNPYEARTLVLKVTPLCNAKAKDYNFSLTLANTMTNSSKTIQLVERVNNFVPFSLSGLFDKSNQLVEKTCNEFDKSVVLQLQTFSKVGDEITLSLLDTNLVPLGKEVAYLEKEKYVFETNLIEQVNLIIKKTDLSLKQFVIRATSKNI